jgi:hypothetical protein
MLYPTEIVTHLSSPSFHQYSTVVEISGDGELAVVYTKSPFNSIQFNSKMPINVIESLQTTESKVVVWPTTDLYRIIKVDYMTKEIVCIDTECIRYLNKNMDGWIKSENLNLNYMKMNTNYTVVNNGWCAVQSDHNTICVFWLKDGKVLHKFLQNAGRMQKWQLGPKYITTIHSHTWYIYEYIYNDIVLYKTIGKSLFDKGIIGLEVLYYNSEDFAFYLGKKTKKKLFEMDLWSKGFNDDYYLGNLPDCGISPDQSKFYAHNGKQTVIYNFDNSQKWVIDNTVAFFYPDYQFINNRGILMSIEKQTNVYIPYQKTIKLQGDDWILSDFYLAMYNDQGHKLIRYLVYDPWIMSVFDS